MWDVFGVGNEDTRATPFASCWCLYSRLWAWLVPCAGVSVFDFGQGNSGWALVILITKFLLTNDIFD